MRREDDRIVIIGTMPSSFPPLMHLGTLELKMNFAGHFLYLIIDGDLLISTIPGNKHYLLLQVVIVSIQKKLT